MYNARVMRVDRDPKVFLANANKTSRGARETPGVSVLILLLAFALRFYHLGYKSLWGDEIAVGEWSRWTLEQM